MGDDVNIKRKKNEQREGVLVTGLARAVVIKLGATALALMPSFAHSQAKFLASWFKAPVNIHKQEKITLWSLWDTSIRNPKER